MKRYMMTCAVLAMLCGGCSDPESSRLAVGSKAFLVPRGEVRERVYLTGTGDSTWPDLPMGTHVSVVDDGAAPEHDRSSRDVKVHVEDGDFRGKTGVVTRWHLRPE